MKATRLVGGAMAKVGSNPAVITNHEITGITYTFALKGTW